MKDLIDRQAAIEAMGKAKWAKERLMELPSAQPEVIKCKDCRHSWFSGTATIRGKSYEIYKCNYWDDRVVSSNGYCWVAERITDA